MSRESLLIGRNKVFFIVLVGLLLVAGGYYLYFPGTPEHLQEITIIHTNDIHGQFIPAEATWHPGSSKPMVGGIARLATFLENERKQGYQEDRPVIYIDAGDWFTGTPESDLLGGEPMVEGLNAVELDYTTPGNHEFDMPPEQLIKKVKALEAEVISSNLRRGDTPVVFPGTKKYTVADYEGIKVGFFGLTASSTPEMALPENVEGVTFLEEIDTARKMVKKLEDEEVDLIVGISHCGFEKDRELARKVDGIDILVGGHSHSRLVSPRKVNNTVIVQAGSSLSAAGRLDLEMAGQEEPELYGYSGELVTLYDYRYRPDTAVEKRLQPYLEQVDDELSAVVGTTTAPIKRDPTKTSPLGNLVTDVMRRSVGADLAFQNAFGIRDNLPEGEVTRRDVFSVLPFKNYLVELKLKGKTVRKVFEGMFRGEKKGAVTQFSGAEVEVDFSRPEGKRVVRLYINGQPLEEDKVYTVVTSNFLIDSGEGMKGLTEALERKKHPDKFLYKLLENYLRQNSPVSPPQEQRLDK
ncbi:MAG: bifunctional metallophosphatase/5'-nucleotidase [bacterium]